MTLLSDLIFTNLFLNKIMSMKVSRVKTVVLTESSINPDVKYMEDNLSLI